MNEFSVTAMLVGSTTYAGTGSTDALVSKQIGVFKKDYTRLTAANVATTDYIIVAQGTASPNLGSKKTSPIYLRNVKSWRGEKGIASTTQQISYMGYNEQGGNTDTLKFDCDRVYAFGIRIFGRHVENVYTNGLSRTISYKTACCDPCATGDCNSTIDPSAAADAIVLLVNADPQMNPYVTALKVTTGAGPTLQVGIKFTAQPILYPVNKNVPQAYDWRQDVTKFKLFMDNSESIFNLNSDACSLFNVTTPADIVFGRGSGLEVQQLELENRSYLQGIGKERSLNELYNGVDGFTLDTDTTKLYDIYWLTYDSAADKSFADQSSQQQELIVAFEQGIGLAAEWQAAMNAWLAQAPASQAAVDLT